MIDPIVNNEQGDSCRTKINESFTELETKEILSNKVQNLNNPNTYEYPSTQAIAELIVPKVFEIKRFIIEDGLSDFSHAINKMWLDYGKATMWAYDQNYNRCIFELKQNDEIKYSDYVADHDDLIDQINANCDFSGPGLNGAVHVRVYFNQNLPKISKFWNFNDALAILKGYENLNNLRIVTPPSLTNAFVTALWTALEAEEGAISVTNDERTIWFQRSLKSTYNGFDSKRNNNQGIMFANGNAQGRYCNRTTGVITHVDSVNLNNLEETPFQNRASVLVRITGTDVADITNLDRYPSVVKYKYDNLLRLHALRFQDPVNNRRYYAMLIKPVGIDTILVGASEVDTVTHELYGLFYNNNTNPVIRKLTTETPHSDNTAWTVRKSELFNHMLPNPSKMNKQYKNDSYLKKCKLFYMDENGNASDFSPELVVKTRNRGSEYKLMVNS